MIHSKAFSRVGSLKRISSARFTAISPVSRTFASHGRRFKSDGGQGNTATVNLQTTISSFSAKLLTAGFAGAAALIFYTSQKARADSKPEDQIEFVDEQNPQEEIVESPPEDQKSVLTCQYLIIGAGTAGFTAAQEIVRRDKNAQVLIIAEEDAVPYKRPPLSKELWRSEDPQVGNNLRYKDFEGEEESVFYVPHEEDLGAITLMLGKSVIDLDINKKAVLLDDERIVKFDKCLLATGGRPKSLPVDLPSELEGHVTSYRDINDFRSLEKIAQEAKEIVVVGGSFLGSELACGLAHRGRSHNLKVTQVFPEDGMMGLVFPEYLSQWTTSHVEKELGVQVKPKTLVTGVQPGKNHKVSLSLSSGETLEADHVVVAVGIQPNSEVAFLADLEIDPKNKGVMVNSELQARSDIYAAGDVASYHDVYLGRRRVEHYEHAVHTGRLAGRNMTGSRLPYLHIPLFWSDLGSLGYEAVGRLEGSLETVGVWEKPEGEFRKGVVYYMEDNRVVGVLLWNLFGKTDDARRVIKGSKDFPDRTKLKTAISLEEEDQL